jgi:hypothetical protein
MDTDEKPFILSLFMSLSRYRFSERINISPASKIRRDINIFLLIEYFLNRKNNGKTRTNLENISK